MIKLQQNYSIRSDKTQYTLVQEKTGIKQDTKEPYTYEVTVGYYGDLSQALDAYVNKVILNKIADDVYTLKEVKDLLEEIRKEIKAYD